MTDTAKSTGQTESTQNSKTLLKKVQRLAFPASIGLILLLTFGYLLVWLWMPAKSTIPSAIRDFALSVLPNLIAFFTIFVFSYAFLRYIQEEIDKRRSAELGIQISGQMKSEWAKFKKELRETQPQITPHHNQDSLYHSARELLKNESWDIVRIFAPVGLWKISLPKKKWLEELASYAQKEEINTVYGVYGLPPRVQALPPDLQTGQSPPRPTKEIVEDLYQAYKRLEQFDNGLGNVVLRYIPPVHASVGFGSIIFQRQEGRGAVALAFATHYPADVVDAGFSTNDKTVITYAEAWFQSRIFDKAVKAFILQDENESLKNRWPKIIELWYGNKILTAYEAYKETQEKRGEEEE